VSPLTWVITTLVRGALTGALLFWIGAPVWAALLAVVVVYEAATAARKAEDRV
jgi:hypothetical protein